MGIAEYSLVTSKLLMHKFYINFKLLVQLHHLSLSLIWLAYSYTWTHGDQKLKTFIPGRGEHGGGGEALIKTGTNKTWSGKWRGPIPALIGEVWQHLSFSWPHLLGVCTIPIILYLCSRNPFFVTLLANCVIN